MSIKRIRALYEARLNTWAAARSTPLEVAWQNAPLVEHEPTYLQAFILPALTDSQDLAGSHRAYVGIFQINIVARVRQGVATAEGIADELESLFPQSLRLSDDALTVQITEPLSLLRPIQESDAYTQPVSFTFRADTI